jgi:hypothetical protein
MFLAVLFQLQQIPSAVPLQREAVRPVSFLQPFYLQVQVV